MYEYESILFLLIHPGAEWFPLWTAIKQKSQVKETEENLYNVKH